MKLHSPSCGISARRKPPITTHFDLPTRKARKIDWWYGVWTQHHHSWDAESNGESRQKKPNTFDFFNGIFFSSFSLERKKSHQILRVRLLPERHDDETSTQQHPHPGAVHHRFARRLCGTNVKTVRQIHRIPVADANSNLALENGWKTRESQKKSTNQSINPSNRSPNHPINQSINPSIHQSMSQSNQSINRSNDRSINQLINQSINQCLKDCFFWPWCVFVM